MSDKLQEALIKYREAVATSSPGLPSRLPWVSNSNPPQPRWGWVLFHPQNPNVAPKPATLGWRSKPLRGKKTLGSEGIDKLKFVGQLKS